MKNKKSEKLLYKSLDARLTDIETDKLNKELQNSKELQKERRAIIEVRKMAEESAVSDFKPFFEERVLTKINTQADKDENVTVWASSFTIAFKQVGLTAVFILLILLSYNLKSGNKYSLEAILGISDTTIEYAFDPVNNFIGSGR